MRSVLKLRMLFIISIALFVMAFFTQSVLADKSQFPPKKDWFYGGGIGLGLGDVDYFEISPLAGYNINPRASVGLSLLYRYRKDKRFVEDITTNDYGATLFGRFFVVPRFYLQAEYEYLNYEFYRFDDTTTNRTNFGSFLAGGGASMRIGGNASFYATVLYNFSYDQADSPYSEPLVLRIGVGIGF